MGDVVCVSRMEILPRILFVPVNEFVPGISNCRDHFRRIREKVVLVLECCQRWLPLVTEPGVRLSTALLKVISKLCFPLPDALIGFIALHGAYVLFEFLDAATDVLLGWRCGTDAQSRGACISVELKENAAEVTCTLCAARVRT